MNCGRQLTVGCLIAALAGAPLCASDESNPRRYSAPVRVLPESRPAPEPAGMAPRPAMNPPPTTLVPPQYRTESRSQAPIGSGREEAASSTVRFVVPLVERPVLVEARITIDGKPFRALREDRIDHLLAELAKPATASKAIENPASDTANPAAKSDGDDNASAAANAAPPIDNSLPARLRRYLQSTGRSPTRDELRWLLANWSDGPEVLVLHENFERLRAGQSPLVATLDKDQDGALSADEIAGAREALLQCDRNQDDVVSLDELKAAAARVPEKPVQARRDPAPFIPLADLANRAVLAGLAARYAAERKAGTPGALSRFDLDGDGSVDDDELARLHSAPADLQIDAAFDRQDPSRSHIDVTVLDASLAQAPAAVRGDSITLLAAGTLLEFSAVRSASESLGDQISIGGVRDGYPLLPEIDLNEDGRLTLREIRQASERLAKFDRDRDGAISAGEILPTVRVAIGSGPTVHAQLAALRSVLEPAAAPTVEPPGWFARMDRNKDGDVSRREFLGGQGQFDKLDADSDQLISIEEAARLKKPSSTDGSE